MKKNDLGLALSLLAWVVFGYFVCLVFIFDEEPESQTVSQNQTSWKTVGPPPTEYLLGEDIKRGDDESYRAQASTAENKTARTANALNEPKQIAVTDPVNRQFPNFESTLTQVVEYGSEEAGIWQVEWLLRRLDEHLGRNPMTADFVVRVVVKGGYYFGDFGSLNKRPREGYMLVITEKYQDRVTSLVGDLETIEITGVNQFMGTSLIGLDRKP